MEKQSSNKILFFFKEVWKIIRGSGINRITIILILGGLSLIGTTLWELILEAVLERELDIIIPNEFEPLIGFTLILLGLFYHYYFHKNIQNKTFPEAEFIDKDKLEEGQELRKKELGFIKNSCRTYYYEGRINQNGDFTSIERKRFTKIGDNPFRSLELITIKTFAKDIIFNKPKIIDSSNPAQKILYHYSEAYDKDFLIDNSYNTYKCLNYSFDLAYPLRYSEDYVEFEVESKLIESSKNVFTENGTLGGFFMHTYTDEIDATIFALNGYKIEIIEFHVEDEHGNRNHKLSEELRKTPPMLNNNSSKLKWKLINPVFRHCYLFRYRFIKLGG